MICPYCGQEHPDNAVFCPSTGQKIDAAHRCSSCGTQLQVSWKVCPKCGTRVNEPGNVLKAPLGEISQSQKKKIMLWASLILTILILALLVYRILPKGTSKNEIPGGASAEPKPAAVDARSGCEQLTVPYTGGMQAVISRNSFQGPTEVTSSGYGSAGGDWVTDSFYLFRDKTGDLANPRLPNEYNEYILHINQRPAFTLIEGQGIPEYRSDHIYSFTIDAPGGQLILGVNDKFLTDNSGSYDVTLCVP